MARARATYELRATDKSAAGFNSFRGRLRSLGRSISVISGLSLAGAAGLAALTKRAVDSTDEIGKLSTRLGASTEALSQYQLVADKTGVSFQTLTLGLQRMTRRVAEAAKGTGEAKDALRELGVDARQLNRLRPEQQFEILADAFLNVGNSGDRVRLTMKLFDSEAVSLLQTMEGGSAAIRELRNEADRLGLTIDENTAAAAAEANDNFAALRGAAKGLSITLVRELGPDLADISRYLAESLPAAAEVARKAFNNLLGTIAVLNQRRAESGERGFNRLARIAGFLGFEQAGFAAQNKGEEFRQQAEQLSRVVDELAIAQGKADEFKRTMRQATDDGEALGLGDVGAVVKDANKVREIIEGLQEEVRDFGLTSAQKKLNELIDLGASEKQIGVARSLVKELTRQSSLDEFRSLVDQFGVLNANRSGFGAQVSRSRFAFNDQTTRNDESTRILRDIRDLIRKQNQLTADNNTPLLPLSI